jgi:membrane protein implicated in regulation of membrane protease activity
MTWWIWMIAGACLLGAELSFISAQFYLVFAGIAAIAVGVLAALLPDWPIWQQWLAFAALAIVLSVTFRRSIYERLRGTPPPPGQANATGGILTLPTTLAPGGSCQVEYRGSYWTATNGCDTTLEAGQQARVTRVHGLVLIVGPETV